MGSSWPVSMANARAKLRRPWLCVGARGVLFIGCTLPNLTETYRTLGMASPSNVARKTKNRPLPATKSMRSPGERLSAEGRRPPQLLLSVSSGLQRPENVLAGILCWPDYRSKDWPSAIKILHHKTGATVWHPLEDTVNADVVRFYPEAEAILEKLPRRGVPMILREIKTPNGVAFKPYSYGGFEKLIQNLRKKISDAPNHFTLDACRHVGMTELEEAALTEDQGRALSGHKTAQSYRGYAKDTFDRALSATRKRHAHRLANARYICSE